MALISNKRSSFVNHLKTLAHPSLLMMRPLETLWANHSEKLRGQSYERGAAMTQPITDTRNIQSQVTVRV